MGVFMHAGLGLNYGGGKINMALVPCTFTVDFQSAVGVFVWHWV